MIRIGNASGYWGDDPEALSRQVFGKLHLDYITMDFLAEITMSIMQKQRSKDPQAGYARDFIPMMEAVFKKILADGTKIITNAGGINPESCALALQELATRLGLKPRIAVVYGDDILKDIPALIDQGIEFKNMESGRLLGEHKNQMLAANVYFGALPVARALSEWQPDIVITGRVTDTGITLGAMIHEFGWHLEDYDKLASGIVAGHLIECGSQATGGNFSDWHKVSSYHNIGYPIIEMADSGEFVVTKHPGTGGLVSIDTIREQLVYEMGDPKAYITPDVVADFSTVELVDDGHDRVRVCSVKGMAPTPFFKVSMAYQDGFKCIGEIAISGPKAQEKASMFADIFWSRAGRQFTQTETEFFGLNACHRGLQTSPDAHEIILRLGAQDSDDKKLKKFSKLVPSLILGGPAGVAVLGGAPRVQSIVSYWPALIPKTSVVPQIALLTETKLGAPLQVPQPMPPIPHGFSSVPKNDTDVVQNPSQPLKSALLPAPGSMSVPKGYQRLPLSCICLARSGDKGDSANIGLLARSPEAFEYILKGVSAQKIKDLFQDFCFGSVIRYQVPRILGLNFILENALGGGGTVTLRADAQGKTLAQALLNVEFLIPDEVIQSVEKKMAAK
jgi:hypothetical protein